MWLREALNLLILIPQPCQAPAYRIAEGNAGLVADLFQTTAYNKKLFVVSYGVSMTCATAEESS